MRRICLMWLGADCARRDSCSALIVTSPWNARCITPRGCLVLPCLLELNGAIGSFWTYNDAAAQQLPNWMKVQDFLKVRCFFSASSHGWQQQRPDQRESLFLARLVRASS
jgi:hypothetical protein